MKRILFLSFCFISYFVNAQYYLTSPQGAAWSGTFIQGQNSTIYLCNDEGAMPGTNVPPSVTVGGKFYIQTWLTSYDGENWEVALYEPDGTEDMYICCADVYEDEYYVNATAWVRLVHSQVTVVDAPGAISTTNVTKTSFTANWQNTTTLDNTGGGLKVKTKLGYSTDPTMNPNNDTWIDVTGLPSYPVTGLKNGTEYYWELIAQTYNTNTNSYDYAEENYDWFCGAQTFNWNGIQSVTTIPACKNVAISLNPIAKTVCSGSSVYFTVKVTGDATVSYNWQQNGINLNDGSNISGSQTDSLIIKSVSSANIGSYTCYISNSCPSNAISTGANLSLNNPLVISQQPQNTTECTSGNSYFKVKVNGSAPISYQWKKNNTALTDGSNITGSLTDSLSIKDVSTSDSASYSCTISNPCGSTLSNSVKLKVNSNLNIIIQPVATTVCSGNTADFIAKVSGTEPISYQWKKNDVNITDGANITGSLTDSLVINNADQADSGSYSCHISNICGNTSTNSVIMKVNNSLTITKEPVTQSLCMGQDANFTVNVEGAKPMSFQWKKNNEDISDGANISGSNTDSLSIKNISATDSASYLCSITNLCGTIVTSNTVKLKANSKLNLYHQPVGKTICSGNPVSFVTKVSGSSPISYQWKKNNVNITDGTNITGSLTDSLVINNTDQSDSGAYTCHISNFCGDTTTISAKLKVNKSLAITSQPVSQYLCVGHNAYFSVHAEGTSPISYQWKKNNINITYVSNITGSLTDSITISNVSSNDTASYFCTLTNLCGTTDSKTVILKAIINSYIAQQPVSQSVCQGLDANFKVKAVGSELSYQWRTNQGIITDGQNITGSQTDSLTITNLSLSDSAHYYCLITSECGNLKTNSAELIVNENLTILNQPVPEVVCKGQSAYFKVNISGSQPVFYQWLKNNNALTDGNNISGSETDSLSFTNTTASDSASYYCTVSNMCGNLNTNSVRLYPESIININSTTPDMTRCIGQSASFSVSASGGIPISYQWTQEGANVNGATNSIYTINNVSLADSAKYFCYLSNVCGDTFSLPAKLNVVDTSIIIIQNPDSVDECETKPATLSVIVSSAGPVAYQWLKEEKNINGATKSTYFIDSLRLDDADYYQCKISNKCKTVYTNLTTITVNPLPYFNGSSISVTKQIGDNVKFSLSPLGQPPFTYQWYLNNNLLAGVTSSVYYIPYIVLGDSGVYTCNVSNNCGSKITGVATLNVKPGLLDTYTISGMVTYDNTTSTPMNGVQIILMDTTGDKKLDTTVTDNTGYYEFYNVHNSNYTLIFSTTKATGGYNPLDALKVNRYYLGAYKFGNSVDLITADVNYDHLINPLDALYINRRYLGVLKSFKAGTWYFQNPVIKVYGNNVINNIKAECYGDVDGSYNPPK